MKKNDAMITADAPIVLVSQSQPPRALWATLFTTVAVFSPSLYALAAFALGSDLYSYILLIPAISAYLFWSNRRNVHASGQPAQRLSLSLFLVGAAGVITDFIIRFSGAELPKSDRLAIMAVAFVSSLAGGCAWFLSRSALRALSFPLGFLLFVTPLPAHWLTAIESFMQHGSAVVAHELFRISGAAVFYDQLIFQLPRITLHVAPECSGIRSTMALLILSVLAGGVFLRRPGHRLLVVLAVVPLALLRNGLRIFVIGELCTHYGPQMIDSFIHRRGGPFFFALSLVPFFLLLVFLQRREQHAARS